MRRFFILSSFFVTLSLLGFTGENPFGVNASIRRWWRKPFDSGKIEEYKAYLDYGDTLGVIWWRAQFRFGWYNVQPDPNNPDSFDFSDEDSLVKWTGEKGIVIIPVFGYTAKWAANSYVDEKYQTIYPPDPLYWSEYKEYVSRLVERYDGDGEDDFEGLIFPIKYWQCMNEPYGDYFLGTQAQYEEVFESSYVAIMSADSNAKILGPCLKSVPKDDDGSTIHLNWHYYNINSGKIENEYPNIYTWKQRIARFIANVTNNTVDISNLVIAHHLYQRKASQSFSFLRELLDTLDILYPEEEMPVFITEVGYGWNNWIRNNGLYTYDADSGESFIVTQNLWFGPQQSLKSIPVTDTVLVPGEIISVPEGSGTEDVVYQGGDIKNSQGQVVLAQGDSITVIHHYMRHNIPGDSGIIPELTATPETQATNYSELIDSIFNNQSIANRIKVFFFCLDSLKRLEAPRIKNDSLVKKDYYSVYSTIIDSVISPLSAYYRLKDQASGLRYCNSPEFESIVFMDTIVSLTWKDNSYNNLEYYIGKEITGNYNGNDTTFWYELSSHRLPHNAESFIDTMPIAGVNRYRVAAYGTHSGKWYSDYETFYIPIPKANDLRILSWPDTRAYIQFKPNSKIITRASIRRRGINEEGYTVIKLFEKETLDSCNYGDYLSYIDSNLNTDSTYVYRCHTEQKIDDIYYFWKWGLTDSGFTGNIIDSFVYQWTPETVIPPEFESIVFMDTIVSLTWKDNSYNNLEYYIGKEITGNYNGNDTTFWYELSSHRLPHNAESFIDTMPIAGVNRYRVATYVTPSGGWRSDYETLLITIPKATDLRTISLPDTTTYITFKTTSKITTLGSIRRRNINDSTYTVLKLFEQGETPVYIDSNINIDSTYVYRCHTEQKIDNMGNMDNIYFFWKWGINPDSIIYQWIEDTISPSVEIAGGDLGIGEMDYNLQWSACDNEGIKKQQLEFDGDTIELDSYAGEYTLSRRLYNGWYNAILIAEDGFSNSSSDTQKVALSNPDSSDISISFRLEGENPISIYLQYSIPWKKNHYNVYHKINSNSWYQRDEFLPDTTGEFGLTTVSPGDTITAFMSKEYIHTDTFTFYSNVLCTTCTSKGKFDDDKDKARVEYKNDIRLVQSIGRIVLDVESANERVIEFKLYDIVGRELDSKSLKLNRGIRRINLNVHTSGIYFIKAGKDILKAMVIK
ncbi:hypothetical protein KAW18_13875 [candidate division WOR-3 bacterium]|nr:hypothetical protein [candidate division WOR-3 bacterium]